MLNEEKENKNKQVANDKKIIYAQLFIDNVLTAIHMTPCSEEEKQLIAEVMQDSDILLLAENREWRRSICIKKENK